MVIAFFFERGFRPIGNFLYINGFSMEHPASKQIAHKPIKAVEGVFVFSYLANIVLCDIMSVEDKIDFIAQNILREYNSK